MIKRVPWDHSALYKECPNDSNDKSPRCEKKSWHSDEDIQLTSDVIKTLSNINLDDCLNVCMENNNCVAVARNKKGNKECHVLGGKYQRQENEEYDSHILKCCTFQDHPHPPPPPPPEVTTIPPNTPNEFDLPFMINLNYDCYDRFVVNPDYSPSSPGLTWYFIEDGVDFAMTPYTNLTKTGTQACQRECARDTKCRAVSVEWNGNVCHFFDHFNNKESTKNVKQTFFIKFKCEKSEVWGRQYSHMSTANYHPFCEQISNIRIHRRAMCRNLFWLFLDEIRYDVPAKVIFDLEDGSKSRDFSYCLNKCLGELKNCFAVSIDHSQRKCYMYEGKTDDNVNAMPDEEVVGKPLTQQYSWSTYKLQCCDFPKIEY